MRSENICWRSAGNPGNRRRERAVVRGRGDRCAAERKQKGRREQVSSETPEGRQCDLQQGVSCKLPVASPSPRRQQKPIRMTFLSISLSVSVSPSLCCVCLPMGVGTWAQTCRRPRRSSPVPSPCLVPLDRLSLSLPLDAG